MDLTKLSNQELIKHIPTKLVQKEWQNRGIIPNNLVYVATADEVKQMKNLLSRYHKYHGDRKTELANNIYDFLYDISNGNPYILIGNDVYDTSGLIVGNKHDIKKLHKTTTFESYFLNRGIT